MREQNWPWLVPPVGVPGPRPLARRTADILQRPFFLRFGNEQGEAAGEPQDPQDAEKICERDIPVARLEILVTLDGYSRAAREFGLAPVESQAMGAHALQEAAHHGVLASP